MNRPELPGWQLSAQLAREIVNLESCVSTARRLAADTLCPFISTRALELECRAEQLLSALRTEASAITESDSKEMTP
jgi:hypothetical protein